MKIKSVNAEQIYRLKISGRPVPNQPEIDEVITDGRGNWAVNWGDEWSWGYADCQGFKELESSFQKQLAKESSSKPPKKIPGLFEVDHEYWDDVKHLFGPHPDAHLPRRERRRASCEVYREAEWDSSTQVEYGVMVERGYEEVEVEVRFYIRFNWLPVRGVCIDAAMKFVLLDLCEDPIKAWADQIYPCIQECYAAALKDTLLVIDTLASAEGCRQLSKELSPFVGQSR